MPKKFLSVNDVSKILGVTPLTVRNWDKNGRLTAYRNPFNNYRMYKVEDVEAILKKIDSSKSVLAVAQKNTQDQATPRQPESEKPKTVKLAVEEE